jgi:HAMP domain-containing protein
VRHKKDKQKGACQMPNAEFGNILVTKLRLERQLINREPLRENVGLHNSDVAIAGYGYLMEINMECRQE